MPIPVLPQRPLAAQVASQTGLGRDSTCWSQVVLVLQEGPGAQRSQHGPLGTRVCSVGREEGTCPSPVTRPCLSGPHSGPQCRTWKGPHLFPRCADVAQDGAKASDT